MRRIDSLQYTGCIDSELSNKYLSNLTFIHYIIKDSLPSKQINYCLIPSFLIKYLSKDEQQVEHYYFFCEYT